MTSMVLKLQADALNPAVPVVSLLRTAKAVATKLDLEDALIWIDRELDGYDGVAAEDLPPYRNLTGEPKAWNPYHGWQPIHFEEVDTLKLFSQAPVGMPLGAIEEMLKKNNGGQFQFPYQPEHKTMLMKAIDFPTDAHVQLSTGSIIHIIDAVRNFILNWSLKLEKAGIMGEGMTFTDGEKMNAAPITQTFINSNIGTVGNVGGGAIVSGNMAIGLDRDQVRNLLSEFGAIRDVIPKELSDELTPMMEQVAEELSAPDIEEGKIQTLLASAKNICEGATGSVAAQGILSLIEKIF